MAGPFPSNVTISFSVASGALAPDPVTGNWLPTGQLTLQLKAYLTPQGMPGVTNPRSKFQPGLDEMEEALAGYLQEVVGVEGTPAELPTGIGHLSKGWAEIRNVVTDQTRSGWFTIYRGTSSAWGIEASLGAKIAGVFKGVAGGSGAGNQAPLPTPGQYPAPAGVAARKMVALIGGSLTLADQSNLSHLNAVAGMTLNAVTTGGKPQIIREGWVEDAAWSWTPQQPIYLGTNGNLTQDGASITVGFLQQVGWVAEPTKIWLELEEPIRL